MWCLQNQSHVRESHRAVPKNGIASSNLWEVLVVFKSGPLFPALCVCMCVWKCLQGKVGNRYSTELFSALEMLPAHFLWGLWQMFLQTLYCENRLCFLFALWQKWPLIWLKLDFLLLEIVGWRCWRCHKDENIGSCYQTAFLLLL